MMMYKLVHDDVKNLINIFKGLRKKESLLTYLMYQCFPYPYINEDIIMGCNDNCQFRTGLEGEEKCNDFSSLRMVIK